MKLAQPNGDVYSSYKAAMHRDKMDQIRRGELITPLNIQWDLTNQCNLNCVFCFYHLYPLTDWDRKATMDTTLVMELLGEVSRMGVRSIEWTGGGEPTLHKDWRAIFTRAATLGFEQALVTNGTLLKPGDMPLLAGFEWVRFSVDAATAETYVRTKGGDYFQKVIDNITLLLKVRKPENVIGFSFIVCPENYMEIGKAASLAKSLGCDNIRFSLAMTPKHDALFEGIWSECVKQLDEARSLEDDHFRVFAFSNRINALSQTTLSHHCHYCQFVAVIAPAGLYPCCRLKDEGKFNLGALDNHASFGQVWFSQKRADFVKSVAKHGCLYDCWMTDKNEFIHYLTLQNPRHGNFV